MNLLKSILLTFLLFSVSNTILAAEAPEFIKLKNWQIHKIGANKMVLTCKAVFYNPNKAKAKLTDINFNIAIGDTHAGKVTQSEKKVKIKKRQAFEIPLKIEINPETNAWGYIQGVLSALTLQDFVVTITGHIKVKVFGMPIKLNVREQEELNLKEILID